LRTAKNELGIAPGAKLDAYLPEPSAAARDHRRERPGDRPPGAAFGDPLRPGPAGAAMQIGAGDATSSSRWKA
jgi:valyl-tRNA synthetase